MWNLPSSIVRQIKTCGYINFNINIELDKIISLPQYFTSFEYLCAEKRRDEVISVQKKK